MKRNSPISPERKKLYDSYHSQLHKHCIHKCYPRSTLYWIPIKCDMCVDEQWSNETITNEEFSQQNCSHFKMYSMYTISKGKWKKCSCSKLAMNCGEELLKLDFFIILKGSYCFWSNKFRWFFGKLGRFLLFLTTFDYSREWWLSSTSFHHFRLISSYFF